MAQGADITVNDGTATPVAVVFKIVQASPSLSIWKDKRLGSKSAQWPEITLSANIPGPKTTVRKAEQRIAVPVIDTLTGTVVDVCRARIVYDLPVSATNQNLNDLYAFTMNSVAHALIKGAVRDLDTIVG
ncbi:TPA_asm: coat protein [ssRNA phage SRR6960509_9]|uniref:Coat protein n=1 Tax=ssRNA phage SRR6960509_9 TaxID=2786536 RepID=A0A8S5L5D5_9VIRU|nr:coat protein [ssRNA phage SRR6960509_9]DAD52581.1 TPA_asm: coat protein [ssRNA phage SRR6960509_9]